MNVDFKDKELYPIIILDGIIMRLDIIKFENFLLFIASTSIIIY